ncbi:MAG: NADH-quinone oxidoreductase subunit J [candidate division Zixibacteria bacterium]|nr:NADH-quinone oxidoreductase subunit J [candidate division Zixibacteria bacterium]
MLLDTAIFYICAIFAVGGAVMMILQRNPVASVMFMIVSLIAQAVLYVQLSALFVGALLIIVYAGAILVLFLFVIMLLNLRGEKFESERPKLGLATKYSLVIVLFIEVVIIIKQTVFSGSITKSPITVASDFGNVKPVAELLFTKYLFPFELTSILLLVAIIGAVLMAKREKNDKGEQI